MSAFIITTGTDSPNENPANHVADDASHMTSNSEEDDEEDGDSTDEDCGKTATEDKISDVNSRNNTPTQRESPSNNFDGVNTEVVSEDANSESEKCGQRDTDAPLVNCKYLDNFIHSNDHKNLIVKSESTETDDVKHEPTSPTKTSSSSVTSHVSPLTFPSKQRDTALPTSTPNMAVYESKPVSLSDDQPLDLSKKTDLPILSNSSSAKPAVSSAIHHLPKTKASSPTSSLSAANGLSSLQSLQQRFGSNSPMEPIRRSATNSVIALQPSMTPKGMTSSLHPSTEELIKLQGASSRSKIGLLSDWVEKGDGRMSRSPSHSPSRKGEALSHYPPLMSPSDESSMESRNKHTIHRCSCQKSFNSLYAMSVHIQETGHTPLSGKAMSLMDYPKLVRGQDMWLNQESEQTRRILRCMQCGESFKSLPLLTVHMMQTQHYTKIVSSEHGRRSHKCSTYCDRDLDRECIFKCKVCQDAFTDMEGLANHMILSGHHKKQSSRVIPTTSSILDVAGNLASSLRHGKRKRFPQEDEPGTNGFTVANLLEFKRKHDITMKNINGMSKMATSSTSPTSPSPSCKFFTCDSCGKKVEANNFDGHVLACLRQRAEVIDALKSKLAAEEAILSRSENKLLRSGFALTSMPSNPFRDDTVSSRTSLERREEEFVHRKRTRSDAALGGQSPGLISKPKKDVQTWSKSEGKSPSSPEKNQLDSGNSKSSDFPEDPQKWWRHSELSRSKSQSPPLPFLPQDLSRQGFMARVKEEVMDVTSPLPIRDETTSHGSVSDSEEGRSISGTHSGDKSPVNSLSESLLKPNISKPASELDKGSIEYSSSALHKLDMFSRGLPLPSSVPREPKLSPKPHSRFAKRGEANENAVDGKKFKSFKSGPSSTPVSVSSSASPSSASLTGNLVKCESPDSHPRSASFDILDPNADDGKRLKGSALEAMESFIKKSFSAKSELRTSNLVSMFSPFGNSFPLPGSISGAPGIPVNPSDPSAASFAKFSKFFGMIPGASILHPSSVHASSLVGKEALSHEFQGRPGKRPSPKGDNPCMSPPLKIPAVNLSNSPHFPPWKHRGHIDRKIESTSDNKNKEIKANDTTSSIMNSHRKRPGYFNGASDSSTFQNGESRLPSSSELSERQEYLRKKRVHVADDNTDTSKSLKTDKEKNDDSRQKPRCVRRCEKEPIKDDEPEKKTRENHCEEDDSRRSVISSPHQSLIVPKCPPESSRSPLSHSPIPESHRKDSDSKIASSPDCLDEKAREPLPEGDVKSSSIIQCHSEKKSLHHESSPSEITMAFCSSPESTHSDSTFLGGEKFCIPRQRSNSMEENISFSGSRSFCHLKYRYSKHSDIKGHGRNRFEHGRFKHGKILEVGAEDFDRNHREDNNIDEAISVGVNHELPPQGIERLCDDNSDPRIKVIDSDVKDCEDFDEEGRWEKEKIIKPLSMHSKMHPSSKSPVITEKFDADVNDSGNDNVTSDQNPEDVGEEDPKEGHAVPNGDLRLHSDKDDGGEESDEDEGSSQRKGSALDSLSSFVYSQPLTSEHPLDSLQRLFTSGEAVRLSSGCQNVSASSPNPSYPQLSSSAPLNLTTKGNGEGVDEEGSGEDNDELENEGEFAEGCLVDGENTEYKCAACNRRFASKGSYRYHLSRCHLSSVKKYGIKEAFNMSPYVYLPLDHTAKFSKYYQLAQELASKGK